jgi:hypothetical protein
MNLPRDCCRLRVCLASIMLLIFQIAVFDAASARFDGMNSVTGLPVNLQIETNEAQGLPAFLSHIYVSTPDTLPPPSLPADSVAVPVPPPSLPADSVAVPVLLPAQSDTTLTATDSLDFIGPRSRFPALERQSDRIRTFHARQFPVYPMLMSQGHSKTVLTDSTLRWSQWLEWSDKLSRQPGVISYRTGGFNRSDYHYIYGHGLRSQRVYLEGMSLQNPVTGQPHHAHLSLERLARATMYPVGLTHRTDFELLRYYSRRPLTRVFYEQSAFDLRSTEGQISHMLSRRQGIEFLYHGRNHAGEYRRSATDAREISARTFYHISQRYMAQVMLLYNGIQLQEPDGYAISDPNTFTFNRFAAAPRQPNARSSVRNSQFQVALMRRAPSRADSTGEFHASRQADSRIVLHIDRYRRFYYANTDSSWLRYRSFNLNARHHQHSGPFEMQYELRTGVYLNLDENKSALDISRWSDAEAEVRGRFLPAKLTRRQFAGKLAIPFDALITRRSDGFTGWEAGLGGDLDVVRWLRIYASVHAGEQIPTIQQLYWKGDLTGTASLETVYMQRLLAGITLRPRSTLLIDANAWVQQQDNMTALRTDSVFTRLSDVGHWGAVVVARYETPRWDIQTSGTLMQYRSKTAEFQAELLAGSGLRFWNRSSVHWKGYMFSEAAFVRMGVYALFSPNAYRPARYLPVADYWDAALPESAVPGFARVDLDLSARVRALMFLLRWENVTQGSISYGYFESTRYPMPSRRLRFGLRVYFTD